jgi:hypothetical protein
MFLGVPKLVHRLHSILQTVACEHDDALLNIYGYE